jgi:hypothetical protein
MFDRDIFPESVFPEAVFPKEVFSAGPTQKEIDKLKEKTKDESTTTDRRK